MIVLINCLQRSRKLTSEKYALPEAAEEQLIKLAKKKLGQLNARKADPGNEIKAASAILKIYLDATTKELARVMGEKSDIAKKAAEETKKESITPTATNEQPSDQRQADAEQPGQQRNEVEQGGKPSTQPNAPAGEAPKEEKAPQPEQRPSVSAVALKEPEVKPATELPQVGDEVKWTDGAGHEAISTLKKIVGNVGWVDHFGMKAVPLDQFTIGKKSTRRLNEEKGAAEAALPKILAKEEAKPEKAKQKQPINPIVAKEQKKYLLDALDTAIADAPTNIDLHTWADDEEIESAAKDTGYSYYASEPGRQKLIANRLAPLFEKYGITVDRSADGQPVVIQKKMDDLRAASGAARNAAMSEKYPPHITIEVPGDGTFKLGNDKDTLKAFAKRAKAFPTSTPKPTSQAGIGGTPRPTKITPLPAKPLTNLETLKVVGAFASDDEARHVLQHSMSDGTHLVATDGKTLIVLEGKFGGTPEKPAFYFPDGRTQKETDFQYPAWKTALGWDDERQPLPGGAVDTGRIQQVVKQAAAVFKDTQNKARPWLTTHLNPDNTLGVSALDHEDASYEHNVSPDAKRLANFDIEYLDRALTAARQLGHEKVTIERTGDLFDTTSTKPFILKAGNMQIAVMGMHINTKTTEEKIEDRKAELEAEKNTPEPEADTRSVRQVSEDNYFSQIMRFREQGGASNTSIMMEAARTAQFAEIPREKVRRDFLEVGIKEHNADYALDQVYGKPEKERTATNEAFQNMVDTMKSDETGKGVALSAAKPNGEPNGKKLGDVLGDLNDYEPTPEDLKAWQDLNNGGENGQPKFQDGTTIPEMPEGGIGIRNAYTDWQRQMRGLSPRMKEAARRFGPVWKEAMQAMEENPHRGRQLVDTLNSKPRPISDLEDAILAHEMVTRSTDQDNAARAVNDATTPLDLSNAREWLTRARDNYSAMLSAAAAAGTANARGLNARRMFLKEDFSLPRLEARIRANYGGAFPEGKEEEILKHVAELQARIVDKDAKLADIEKELEDAYTQDEVDAIVAKEKAKPTIITRWRTRAPTLEESFADKKAKALEALKGAGLNAPRPTGAGLSAPSPDEKVSLLTDIGAANHSTGARDFDSWVKAMEADGIGDLLGSEARDIFAKSKTAYEKAFSENLRKNVKIQKPKGVLDEMKDEMQVEGRLDRKGIRALALAYIKDGVHDAKELLAHVLFDVREVDPEATEREVSNAISRYGDPVVNKQTDDQRVFHEVAAQLGLLSAIEDAEKDIAPLRRGGKGERKPSDKVRELSAQLREAMKEHNIQVTDPATQLKTAKERLRSHLKNRKVDLLRQLAAKKRDVKVQTPDNRIDPDIKALQDEVAALDEALDAFDPKKKPELTDAQRTERAIAAVNAVVKRLGEMKASGKVFDKKPKGKQAPETTELKAARDLRDTLQDEIKTMREALDPSLSPVGRALKQLKRIANKSARTWLIKKDLMERDGFVHNYTVAKAPRPTDAELEKAMAESIQAKRDYLAAEYKALMSQRHWTLRYVTHATDWARFAKVMGFTIFGKLGMAASGTFVTEPLESMASMGLSVPVSLPLVRNLPVIRSLREIFEKDPRGASLTLGPAGVGTMIQAESGRIYYGLVDGWGNFGQRIKSGSANWEKPHEQALGEDNFDVLQRNWMQYGYNTHAAIKGFAVDGERFASNTYRDAWAKAYPAVMQTRLQEALARGVPMTHPIAQMWVNNAAVIDAMDEAYRRQKAYLDGQYIRLGNKNWMHGLWQAATRFLRTSDLVGKAGPYMEQLFKFLLPIVKIPTNWAIRTHFYGPTGWIHSAVETAHAIYKGTEKLTPEQASTIRRHWAKGAVGMALFLLGWYAGGDDGDQWLQAGGYYQEHEKRKEGAVKAARFRLFGHDIPTWMSHTPALWAIQMGATARRVNAAYNKKAKKHHEEQGLGFQFDKVVQSTASIAKGEAEELPFSHTLRDLADLTNSEKRPKALGNMVASAIVPRAASDVAEYLDRRDGEAIQRDPKGFKDAIKAKTPFFRPDVYEKGGAFDSQGFEKGKPHPTYDIDKAIDTHNKVDPEHPWHVAKVGAVTLNKIPTQEGRDAFAAAVQRFTREASATGVERTKSVNVGTSKSPLYVEQPDPVKSITPVSPMEAENPTKDTQHKINRLRKYGEDKAITEYEQAAERMKPEYEPLKKKK